MNPTIQLLPEKKLVGNRLNMTFAENKTQELWKAFMPRRKEIGSHLTQELFSMQVYDEAFDFDHFDPHAAFDKWAAVEVADFTSVPEGMETFTLTGGLYAVFLYKGPASAFAPTFQYIFGTWLPASEYALDNRPHFEILGEKYKNEDPDSEEEIWIPIRKKR